jgi:hypothetical protein
MIVFYPIALENLLAFLRSKFVLVPLGLVLVDEDLI